MSRKPAAGFTGSQRVKAFLLGLRWLSLLLGLVLMWVNAGSKIVPPPGLLKDLGIAVVFLLVVYHAGASVFIVKLSDLPSSMLILTVADVLFGALLTYFYGVDFFLVAFALPVIQASYFFGGFAALMTAIFIGCYYGPLVGQQIFVILRTEGPGYVDAARLRAEMLAGNLLMALVMGWVMSAVRGDEGDVGILKRKNKEEREILLEELSTTKKEISQVFNELEQREDALRRLQEENQESRDDLEGTLKKLHECRHQYQASQQLAQRKEAQLLTGHKRELEETRRDLDDVQKGFDRVQVLLETSAALNTALHRDQAVMNIIECLMKLVPSQTCLLYSVETQDGQVELFPDGGASPYLEYLRNYSIKLGDGAVGWVAEKRTPIRIDKEQAEVEGEEVTTLFSYEKSALVAPLEFDGRLLGVLYLGRAPASSFSQEDFDTLVQFVRMASTVFNNSLLYQRTLSVGIFDDITGLYNALYFDERLTEEVKRGRRYKFTLSLILLDIDNFTRYNDTYGHAEGNQLLKDFAGLLREHTRETDVLARLENDEFAVLLVESEKSNAILIGERIRMALEMRSIGRQARQKVHITVSGGVSAYPVDSQTREQLVERSAEALERARKKGGNQLQY
ncbi:MAG: diguanylate cyclase [Armatimonadetes bacterium]|nr:diguanylate cyclase [Armatimonadota bacterium]